MEKLTSGSENFPFRIAGIPAIVQVEKVWPPEKAILNGPPEDCSPGSSGELEFSIFDRKGYRALWLEKKLTPAIVAKIEDFYFQKPRRTMR